VAADPPVAPQPLPRPPGRRFEPWPFGLALLLLAGIGASLAFFAVASANPDAEVVDDAYRAGLQVNEALREQRRAEELGFRMELGARPAPGGVALQVAVTDADGAPAAIERVVVRRERPAEGGFDADFELGRHGEGFAGRIPLPRHGRWRLVAIAEVGGAPLRRVFSFEMRAGS
jgi:nitrogen fixation protein FixH